MGRLGRLLRLPAGLRGKRQDLCVQRSVQRNRRRPRCHRRGGRQGARTHIRRQAPARLEAFTGRQTTPGRVVRLADRRPRRRRVEAATGRSCRGRFVYVTCEADNTVVAVDTKSLKLVERIATAARLRSIAFAADGATAFVSAEIGGSVVVFDANTHRVLATIPVPKSGALPSAPLPMGLALAPDGRRLLVSSGRRRSVVVIDVGARAVVQEIHDVGTRPWGIGVSPVGGRPWESSFPVARSSRGATCARKSRREGRGGAGRRARAAR